MQEPLLWVIVTELLIALVLPFMLTELFKRQGPHGLSLAAVLSVFGGAATGGLSAFYAGIPLVHGVIVGTVASASVAYLACSMMSDRIRLAFKNAPAVRDFGRAHFYQLDRAGKGELDESDLLHAIESGKFFGSDLEILSYMLSHIAEIGHVHTFYVSPSVHGGPSLISYRISWEEVTTFGDKVQQIYGPKWDTVSR